MINVSCKDGEFSIEGSLKLGFIGEYNHEVICLNDTLEDIIEDLNSDDGDENDEYSWYFLKKYTDKTDGESIAKAIETYFNNQEARIASNNIVNNQFLANIANEMYNCGYEFWENEELVIEENMPDVDENKLNDAIYKKHEAVIEGFYSYPDEDLSVLFKETFPMFNLDRLISGITPEYLNLENKRMVFQCDDDVGLEVLCGAYAEILEDLSFYDWHNH